MEQRWQRLAGPTVGIKRTRGRDPIALPMEFLSWAQRTTSADDREPAFPKRKRRGGSGSAEGLTAVSYMYGGVVL